MFFFSAKTLEVNAAGWNCTAMYQEIFFEMWNNFLKAVVGPQNPLQLNPCSPLNGIESQALSIYKLYHSSSFASEIWVEVSYFLSS